MSTISVMFAKALADETRQELMKHLCCEWYSVNDLVEKLGGEVKQPTVSHHLKILEQAELVFVRQEGRHRYYTLNQEKMTMCCGLLVRSFAPDYTEKIVPVDAIPVVEK